VIEFFQRLFGKPASSATAKERLRLVLLSDHISLAPDVVEALKHDLVEVISRYVEVDAANCDVTFEQREKQVAMLANIPVLAMRSRPTPRPPGPPAPPPGPPAPADAEALAAAVDAPAGPASAPSKNGNGGGTNGNGGSRRRRRKRVSQSPATAT
jgi:cell division topological specificity factor